MMDNPLRIKTLKQVNYASVRDSIRYIMTYKLDEWWVPRQMQAHMWAIGAKITVVEAQDIMEDIYQEAKDLPVDRFKKSLVPCPRYKCLAFFTPKL